MADVQTTPSKLAYVCSLVTTRVLGATDWAKQNIDTPIGRYVTNKLNEIVWGSPLMAAPLAPITFAVSFATGSLFGLFSRAHMQAIYDNIDSVLNGGDKKENSNLKVSLIFAYMILSKYVPIPQPQQLFAGGAGFVLGTKLALYVPEFSVDYVGRFLDPFLMFIPSPPQYENPK